MAEFGELGATAIDKLADSKHFDKLYDNTAGRLNRNQNQPDRRNDNVPRSRDDYGANAPPRRRHSDENIRQPHRHRNTLPDPEFDDNDAANTPRDFQLEAQSETSERVLRAYENERDDPKRKPSASLVNSNKRNSGAMSRANGDYYARSERPGSQAPPRSRYYDEDEESDYDERTGRRYRSTGRGYDAERDREFDREVVETERYRGVSLAIS